MVGGAGSGRRPRAGVSPGSTSPLSPPAGPPCLPDDRNVDLLDAVILAELLGMPRSRRVLQPRSGGCGEGDQRALPGPEELLARVDAAGAVLQEELERAARQAVRLLRRAGRQGVVPLVFGAPDYPPVLAAIPDPPPVLWCRGRPAALEAPAVAIVGSRTGSPYAREVAARLGADLAGRGVAVVSGLARGVDAAAHRGALDAGGITIAALGCGADVVYPPEHGPLLAQLTGRGAAVSELAPGAPPRPFHFPRRNRIISGLSLAVVVVEASERSGSLITARCAAEQGREVMAVPGNVLSGRCRGGHALIRDGAKVVETAEDILEEIRPQVGQVRHDRQRGDGGRPPEQPDAAGGLLRWMDPGESYDLDELAGLSGLDRSALSTQVLELELDGRITRRDGGRFSRS